LGARWERTSQSSRQGKTARRAQLDPRRPTDRQR
jgi:hypothetical protein